MSECAVALMLTPECRLSRHQLRQLLLNNIADASRDGSDGSDGSDCSLSAACSNTDADADYEQRARSPGRQVARSPVKGPTLESISRRLFHSAQAVQHVQGLSRPGAPPSAGAAHTTQPALLQPYVRDILTQKQQVIRKRKRILLASAEKIQKVYMSECNRDTYSHDAVERARRKIVLSLFHDKEFTVDCTE